MLVLLVVGILVGLYLVVNMVVFIAYHSTDWRKTPAWLEKTYDILLGWM